MCDKSSEQVAIWVGSCLKIAWTKCRASGTSVTDVLWAYNTENTNAEDLSSFSRSLEIALRPHPLLCVGLDLWPRWGKPRVAIAAAELVATGQSHDLTSGHVSLVCHPAGHESFMSSKTFLWLNFVPWTCRLQRNRMFIVCTVAIPTEEGLPSGWAQLPWGKHLPYLGPVV